MSRIGRMPISLPKEVTVAIADGSVQVHGPKGTATLAIPYGIAVTQTDGVLHVATTRKDKPGKSLFGFVRAELANYVTGLTQGFSKVLELSGVGYRAQITGVNLVLTVGFSHLVTIEPPKGITFSIVEGKIVVTGNNKQEVGQVAANIRAVRKPEPYKGKGIKYQGEHIRRKAGKSAKAVGGAK